MAFYLEIGNISLKEYPNDTSKKNDYVTTNHGHVIKNVLKTGPNLGLVTTSSKCRSFKKVDVFSCFITVTIIFGLLLNFIPEIILSVKFEKCSFIHLHRWRTWLLSWRHCVNSWSLPEKTEFRPIRVRKCLMNYKWSPVSRGLWGADWTVWFSLVASVLFSSPNLRPRFHWENLSRVELLLAYPNYPGRSNVSYISLQKPGEPFIYDKKVGAARRVTRRLPFCDGWVSLLRSWAKFSPFNHFGSPNQVNSVKVLVRKEEHARAL